MALDSLDHCTIQCADLAATRDFFCHALGLEDGPRPNIGVPGHWLYCGGVPVVHLMPLRAGAQTDIGTGTFDHVAFRGHDVEDMKARLDAHNVAFRENRLDDYGLHQLFVRDPNGLLVEMNFRG